MERVAQAEWNHNVTIDVPLSANSHCVPDPALHNPANSDIPQPIIKIKTLRQWKNQQLNT